MHLFIVQSFYHVVTLPSDNGIKLGLQSIKLVLFIFGTLGGILELFDIKNKFVYYFKIFLVLYRSTHKSNVSCSVNYFVGYLVLWSDSSIRGEGWIIILLFEVEIFSYGFFSVIYFGVPISHIFLLWFGGAKNNWSSCVGCS